MLSRLNYLLVILIWSTTPLAIKDSASVFSPMGSLFFRILIAAMLGCIIAAVFDGKALKIRRNWTLYLAASLGIFPNMVFVYLASQHLSSGMIALLFGLSPFFTMALSGVFLSDICFGKRQLFAAFVAALGLAVILYAPPTDQDNLLLGLPLMMGSNLVFAASGLWLKRINKTLKVNPTQQCLGALIFAVPGLAICYSVVYQPVITPLDLPSFSSLMYLVVMGSLIGFAAYFKVVKDMSVGSLAIIPFITPALSLAVGMLLAGERFGAQIACGACLICLGLGIYQNLFKTVGVAFGRLKAR